MYLWAIGHFPNFLIEFFALYLFVRDSASTLSRVFIANDHLFSCLEDKLSVIIALSIFIFSFYTSLKIIVFFLFNFYNKT